MMIGLRTHPESLCCVLSGFHSNTWENRFPFFFLSSPSLYSWNWRYENTMLSGILPITSFSKSDLLLIIKGTKLNLYLECVCFHYFGFQCPLDTKQSFLTRYPDLNRVWKWNLSSLFESIPGLDAVKLCSNILCLVAYVWCLNSFYLCDSETILVSLTPIFKYLSCVTKTAGMQSVSFNMHQYGFVCYHCKNDS